MFKKCFFLAIVSVICFMIGASVSLAEVVLHEDDGSSLSSFTSTNPTETWVLAGGGPDSSDCVEFLSRVGKYAITWDLTTPIDMSTNVSGAIISLAFDYAALSTYTEDTIFTAYAMVDGNAYPIWTTSNLRADYEDGWYHWSGDLACNVPFSGLINSGNMTGVMFFVTEGSRFLLLDNLVLTQETPAIATGEVKGSVGSISGSIDPNASTLVVGTSTNLSYGVAKFPISDVTDPIDSATLVAAVTHNELASGQSANYFVLEHYTFDNEFELNVDDANTTLVEQVGAVNAVTASDQVFGFDVASYVEQDKTAGYSHSSFRIVLTDAAGNYITNTGMDNPFFYLNGNIDLLVSTNDAPADLTRGHRILVDRGLQIQAQTFPFVTTSFDMARWAESNFTTVNFQWTPAASFMGEAPGSDWGRYAATSGIWEEFVGGEIPYLSNMVSIQINDEQNVADSTELAYATARLARWRQLVPSAISFTNQYGNQITQAELATYMQTALPDMIMFDTYPFRANLIGGSPKTFYEDMQKYRQCGLDGNDGTGANPIPYALYTQAHTYGSILHTVTESEIRLNQFAAWAFGYKFVSAFTYESPNAGGIDSVLFTGLGTTNPTAEFVMMAETNRQSRNLGDALVRLQSSDVRMIMGLHSDGGSSAANAIPVNVTAGVVGGDSYMSGVTNVTNLGTLNGGYAGDVIVGFFTPLHESFDGETYSNQEYFMVVNGLSDQAGSAAQTRQSMRLIFDMGSSGITSLQRLSRDTGELEIVQLVSDGGGLYHLDITLDGGTGDLFKYDTGAPFVSNPQLAQIPGDANNDGAVDVGDLGILAANYGTASGATWVMGDFNGDGAVDVGDLGILAANYGVGSSSSNWDADYAKVFDTTSDDVIDEEIDNSICSGLGLPLIAGLLIACLMLVKVEE